MISIRMTHMGRRLRSSRGCDQIGVYIIDERYPLREGLPHFPKVGNLMAHGGAFPDDIRI
jgi:hypothetical protein